MLSTKLDIYPYCIIDLSQMYQFKHSAVFNPSTETPTSRMITKSPIVRDMQNWAKNESEKVSNNNTAESIQRN